MNDEIIIVDSENEILEAVTESFINKEKKNNSIFDYKIVDNDKISTLMILNELLLECDEFLFCIAFLRGSGTQCIIESLNSVNKKGTKGKFIIGNKDNFSDPKEIKRINEFKNFDVRINMDDNLHAKGYFFRKGNTWTMLVGSSNLTAAALKSNQEWNLLFNSLDNGKIIEHSLDAFNSIWEKSYDISEKFDVYNDMFIESNQIRKLISNKYKNIADEVTPNKMQIDALKKLSESRKNNNKALIISATGTGKTYLAAFDVKQCKPRKMLFVVHRENIARTAKKSFERIIKDKKMGFLIAQTHDNCEYMFSTVQTLSKDKNLFKFNRDEFDYIIIDEAHTAGATSYQKIIDYFNPKFLLGLTATPERTDGFNVYELFGYNIAYEIRLNDAIENDLVVPFHYYGVSEVMVNGEVINDNSKVSMVEKAKNIKEKSTLYGYSGTKVRGLIFVDSVDNARELEVELNKLGYKSKSLAGNDDDRLRSECIKRLEKEETEYDYLDFIITVNVFNEGIDIPCVNQVLLLRPTQSTIVYVQQLGRGMRKNDNKSYLVIIDFIGNYKNNFLIPIALSGDSSADINYLNLFINSRGILMPGKCTMSFEKIAKELILEKIDSKKFKTKKLIEQDYFILKQRINRIPLLTDFFEQNLISPEHILSFKPTYPEVLESVDKTYHNNFSNQELLYLKCLYREFFCVKRIHEVVILRELLIRNVTVAELNSIIEKDLNINNQIDNTDNAMKHLSNEIFKKDNTRSKFPPLIVDGKITKEFKDYYNRNNEFKMLVNDWINYNLKYNDYYYKQVNETPILRNHDYSRKECFHILNLDYHAGNQVGGYVRDKDSESVLIFMKADKSSFSNEILNKREITWFSKNNRSIKDGNTEQLIAENKLTLHVFIKKTVGEKEYYLGEAKAIQYKEIKNEKNENLVKYILQLDEEMDDLVYNYLTK